MVYDAVLPSVYSMQRSTPLPKLDSFENDEKSGSFENNIVSSVV